MKQLLHEFLNEIKVSDNCLGIIGKGRNVVFFAVEFKSGVHFERNLKGKEIRRKGSNHEPFKYIDSSRKSKQLFGELYNLTRMRIA